MTSIQLLPKKGSTLHDFPYSSPQRKCPHFWIINVTPPGPAHCIHNCIYCYARQAVYSNFSAETIIYNNLPELVEADLKRLDLCPPISISNVSDPCQAIPELREEVKRLIRLLMRYGVAFAINTKGDPAFLLDIPGFSEYKHKFIAITVEGTADVLKLLSPSAPSFEQRAAAVSLMSGLGIDTLIRLDPLFIHLFQALYGEGWFSQIEELIGIFANTGAKHIICSTGRLSKRNYPGGGSNLWQRVYNVILRHSPEAARRFAEDYIYEHGGASKGYLLQKQMRLDLHHRLKAIVESHGMTYAACQELSAAECDSAGIVYCERFILPFSRKQEDGSFKPVPGCTANCHVTCRRTTQPPCGQSRLITPEPFTPGVLKNKKHKQKELL